MVFLVARAFSSGSAALTGVEAISNGVPAFRKPKSRNAATTLLLLGVIAVTLFMGIIMLAKATGVQIAERPHEQLIGAPPDYHQKTLIAQLADAVFHDFPLGLFLIAGVTALILVLAANTAFNGFPVLGSILAQDRYLPRQLHTRGDRLAFSNGILFLAFAAIAFIVAFQAEVTALIQLYIVGVFVSFTLSQIGMVRHWTRLLRTETDPAVRRQDDAVAGDQHHRVHLHRHRADHRGGDEVPGRRVDRDPGDGRAVRDHEVDPQALRHRRARAGAAAGRRGGRDRAAQPQPRHRAGVQAAPADAARAGVRARHPARCAGGHHRQRRRRRNPRAGAQVGGQRYQRAAQGDRLAVSRNHPPGARLRQAGQQGVAAHRGHRVHPRVRRRALVGTGAAQPECAAAEGPAAVHAECDGDFGSVAAEFVGAAQDTAAACRLRATPAGASWIESTGRRATSRPAGGTHSDHRAAGQRGQLRRAPRGPGGVRALRAAGRDGPRAGGRRPRILLARRRCRGARALAGP